MDDGAVNAQLDRFERSSHLARSKRLLRFLRFTVDWALHKGSEPLTEYIIGREVYDRPLDFNPVTDGIVRAEAHRLRAKLSEYYATAGQHDPVIIEYRLGSYVPMFEYRTSEFLPAAGRAVA